MQGQSEPSCHHLRAHGRHFNSPVLVLLRSPVPLPSVLEPVGHLGRREARALGQVLLLPRRRVRVPVVPVPQHVPRLLLEAVARLLAVPDRPRQRELTADTVAADGAEWSSAESLSLTNR